MSANIPFKTGGSFGINPALTSQLLTPLTATFTPSRDIGNTTGAVGIVTGTFTEVLGLSGKGTLTNLQTLLPDAQDFDIRMTIDGVLFLDDTATNAGTNNWLMLIGESSEQSTANAKTFTLSPPLSFNSSFSLEVRAGTSAGNITTNYMHWFE